MSARTPSPPAIAIGTYDRFARDFENVGMPGLRASRCAAGAIVDGDRIGWGETDHGAAARAYGGGVASVAGTSMFNDFAALTTAGVSTTCVFSCQAFSSERSQMVLTTRGTPCDSVAIAFIADSVNVGKSWARSSICATPRRR